MDLRKYKEQKENLGGEPPFKRQQRKKGTDKAKLSVREVYRRNW